MSWLSSLFGSGGEDPEAVRQRQAAAAAQQAAAAQAAQDRQLQVQLDYLNSLRSDQAAKDAEFAAKDPTATRSAALSSINSRYTPGFESTYLPDTYDDELANTVFSEQRSKADEFINNLFKRGVLTPTGRDAASKSLGEQDARVRTQLQDIGSTLLGQERSKLGGIVDTGRQRASTLGVNEAFDFTPYDTQVQSSLSDFGTRFGDAFRAGIPGDLFDTSSLAAIGGGAGGGAGSGSVFDPVATAGGVPTTDETDPFSGQRPIQKRTSTVF